MASKIEQLKCFPEVDAMIREGKLGMDAIAAFIHSQGEYTDATIPGIRRALYRYKSHLPASVFSIPEAASALQRRIDSVTRNVDEIAELEKLFLVQLSRINRSVEIEDTTKFPNGKTRLDIQLAASLLKDMVALKLDMGIYTRADIPIDLKHSIKFEKELDKLPAATRQQLGTAAEAMLARLLNPPAEVAEPDFEVIEGGAGDDTDGPITTGD